MNRRRPVAEAIAVTGLALGAGAAVPRLPRRLRLAGSVVAASAALGTARWFGADRAELGLARADLGRGVRHGAVAAAVIAGVVGVSAASPATRALFADARVTGASPARAAYEVLVRIPVATALAEELLFRGAVLGTWRRAAPTGVAVAASSVAFGVWHVIPALESHAHNPAGARISTIAGGRDAHVVATVLATASAGAGFAALRLRSRSVAAPVLAHAVLNQVAYLAARGAHAARQA